MEPIIQLNWQKLVQEAINRRKQQKFTQKQLATIAGVSHPTLVKFEQLKTNITLASAIKILKTLGLLHHP